MAARPDGRLVHVGGWIAQKVRLHRDMPILTMVGPFETADNLGFTENSTTFACRQGGGPGGLQSVCLAPVTTHL